MKTYLNGFRFSELVFSTHPLSLMQAKNYSKCLFGQSITFDLSPAGVVPTREPESLISAQWRGHTDKGMLVEWDVILKWGSPFSSLISSDKWQLEFILPKWGTENSSRGRVSTRNRQAFLGSIAQVHRLDISVDRSSLVGYVSNELPASQVH